MKQTGDMLGCVAARRKGTQVDSLCQRSRRNSTHRRTRQEWEDLFDLGSGSIAEHLAAWGGDVSERSGLSGHRQDG